MKFTTESVAALPLPGKADSFEWDDDLPGFGVRLRGKTKYWVVQYRVAMQQRRESLGDIRKIRLDDARRIARQRFAQAELGIDPAAERAKARGAAAAAQLTLANVAERYLDAKEDMLRPSTLTRVRHHFAVLFAPLAKRPIETIKRADVAARLQEIAKARGRCAAHSARANLSALFNWAIREGLCDANPVSHTNDPSAGIKPRERVLSDQELVAPARTTTSVALSGC